MKNLDLNSYGVQEMDAKAMEEANGGFNDLIDNGPALRNRPAPQHKKQEVDNSGLFWWFWGALGEATK